MSHIKQILSDCNDKCTAGSDNYHPIPKFTLFLLTISLILGPTSRHMELVFDTDDMDCEFHHAHPSSQRSNADRVTDAAILSVRRRSVTLGHRVKTAEYINGILC